MERILVFIPVYNCQNQIRRVLAKFNASMLDFFSEILIVDNQSTDGTLKACMQSIKQLPKFKISLIQNISNYNLGGSHKVAFNYALEKKFDYIIVLHGDDQGEIQDIVKYIRQGMHRNTDCLLGGRFMKHSRLINYSSSRKLGNIFFNSLFSMACGRKLYDLGSGLNLYNISFLQNRFYLRFPNGLTFNYYMILYTVAIGATFLFFPLSWKEEDQVSNVKLFKQTQQLFRVLYKFLYSRSAFMRNSHEKEVSYQYQIIFTSYNE